MRTRAIIVLSIWGLISICAADAAELQDMMARWTWAACKIELSDCTGGRICAEVIAGPENVGMEFFASELTSTDGA